MKKYLMVGVAALLLQNCAGNNCEAVMGTMRDGAPSQNWAKESGVGVPVPVFVSNERFAHTNDYGCTAYEVSRSSYSGIRPPAGMQSQQGQQNPVVLRTENTGEHHGQR